MPLSADYLPIAVGRDPLFAGEGVSACAFYTSKSALEKIQQDGPAWKLEDARLIPLALRSPNAVFEGLSRPEYSDGLCYAFKPPRAVLENCSADEQMGEMMFLVFTKKEFGVIVFDWEWRPEDPSAPGHPNNWNESFARKVWPKN